MRLLVASCSVTYTGRGDTKLARATRAIIIKEDGAVSIHSDAGNKPLNYMGKGNVQSITENEDGTFTWAFDTRKESIQIVLHEVYSDTSHLLEELEPGLVRDGTEPQLQAWVAAHPDSLGEGYTLVEREYPTGAGPVDLLVRDEVGTPVACEVKRVAMLGAADQVSRYVEALRAEEGFEEVRGMIAALDVRPKTRALAEKRGFAHVTLPADWRASQEPEQAVEGELAVEVELTTVELTD